ncbi:hypothetical protein OSTOST_19065, partial [Ostertagia ostertagi]
FQGMQENVLIVIYLLLIHVQALPFRIDNVRFSTGQKPRPDGPRRERPTRSTVTFDKHGPIRGLKFNGTAGQELSLSMAMLDKIWKPDTYFWNGARSYTHSITTSNCLVRLHPDGTVLYSSRLTI